MLNSFRKTRNGEAKESNRFDIFYNVKEKQNEYDEETISKIYKPKNSNENRKKKYKKKFGQIKNKSAIDSIHIDVCKFPTNKEINKEKEDRNRNRKMHVKEIMKNFRSKTINKENLYNEEIWINFEEKIDIVYSSNATEEPLLDLLENLKKKKEDNSRL